MYVYTVFYTGLFLAWFNEQLERGTSFGPAYISGLFRMSVNIELNLEIEQSHAR